MATSALVKLTGLRLAIALAGGQSKLHRLVGTRSPQLIQYWLRKGRVTNPEWAKKVSIATGVPFEDLMLGDHDGDESSTVPSKTQV